VAGYIHLCPYVLLFEDPMVNVLALVVDENRRGQGIGKRLLSCAEEYAWNGGFSAVRLNSSDYRKEAHLFYRANGYVPKGQTRFLKALAK
jgi:GNAT superfamily N-acetyltransferase